MPARILDGAAYAAEIRGEVAEQVAALARQRRPLKLAAVLMGGDEPAHLYAASQRKLCASVGVEYELCEIPHHAAQDDLHDKLVQLNADPAVTGIILQLPLPAHIDTAFAQHRIDPYKDVEGVSPANIGLLFYGEPIIQPCTALAVSELIRRSGIEVRGANAVMVGQSRIVGRPVTMALLTQMATVTGCHIATRNLVSHTRQAEILVVAVGKPRLITAEHVHPGAVVIDVGINRVVEQDATGRDVKRTVGDVDFAAVRDVAGAITPVPGGVGPMTVAMLLRNTVEAARAQLQRRL